MNRAADRLLLILCAGIIAALEIALIVHAFLCIRDKSAGKEQIFVPTVASCCPAPVLNEPLVPSDSPSALSLPLSESRPSLHAANPVVPAEAASALAVRPSFNATAQERRQAASDKNQRMDELLDLPSIPADYSARMVALYRDDTHDVLTRDFAVQHIGLYAQALHRAGTYDAGSDDARLCRAALLDAAGETGTIVAAAAFRALSDLAGFDSHIEAGRLDEMLVSCAGDGAASTAARVMAVQLCGERAIASSRASLGHILDDPSAPVPLRKAAQWSLSSLEKDSP